MSSPTSPLGEPSSPQQTPLNQLPLTQLKGVGIQLAKKLNNIDINNIQDLLFHLPLRYIDKTRLTPIAAIRTNTEAVFEGTVKTCDVTFGRRRSLLCKLEDKSGSISLRFFHFSNAQKQGLIPGTVVRCYGEARRGSSGLEIYHPEYQKIDAHNPLPVEESLTPIYPTTEKFSQNRWHNLMSQALSLLQHGALEEMLPESLRLELDMPSLKDSLNYLHNPPPDAPLLRLKEGTHPFQQRLAFEELLAHHLSLLKIRRQLQSRSSMPLPMDQQRLKHFMSLLEFDLTQAQQTVCKEIHNDLASTQPMLRLIQGDVGSGKTVVAAIAALQVISNQRQVAIMAPTEILAEQHHISFREWFAPQDIKIAWLTGRLKGKKREEQLRLIASGEAKLVIGTHALFQDEVIFDDLALAIIDEQHRFGVSQRLSLRSKGKLGQHYPHQLIMTATPIPRTLAMSAYADLDCSVIDELPPGRTPIETAVISNDRRPAIVGRVHKACSEGRQAYWVCTLIEESEVLQCQAAEATAEELKIALPNLNIALIHGRMKSPEKAEAMEAFKSGACDLLVATTVIEVGVNVPNASLMIIENPERLGLAQLHQLRGRVGRGAVDSFCILLYNSPLSRNGKERLNVMRETNDGFIIAEKDLELRGPGQVLGTRQTGEMEFKIADLQRDEALLPRIKSFAASMMEAHPEKIDPIIKRWIGNSEEYANA